MAQFNSLLVTGDSRFINMINGACSDCYGTCTTAAATVAKVATITNTATFNLSVGTTVHIKFSNYNSSTDPTLNVNSTGAYPIVKFGTTAVGTGTSTTWRSGATCTLTFDGTSWILHEYDPYCVSQANATGNYNYQLLMSAVPGTETDTQYTTTNKSAKLYFNPSTGKLYANSSEVALKSQIPTTASDIGALPDTTKYAASSSVGGSATSAVKLDTATAGTLTKPCYFSGGTPAACTYELKATVPENAVFTDTWNAMVGATSSAAGTAGYIGVNPPTSGYNTKFWGADATWKTAVTSVTIKGTSPIKVSSESAITTTGTRTISLDTVPIASGGTGATTALDATDNLGVFNCSVVGTALASGTNINTGLDYGKTYYTVQSSATTALTGDIPCTSSGIKIVNFKGYGSAYGNMQLAIGSGYLFSRWTDGTSATSWNPWEAICTTTNLYGTCTTAAATKAKVATVAKQALILTEGLTIRIKFTNGNTATAPTLNYNNTGAYPIVGYGTTSVGSADGTSWPAGAIINFTFDGTSWVINDYVNNNVYQAASTTSSWRKVLLGIQAAAEDSAITAQTGYTLACKSIEVQPSTGTLRTPKLKPNSIIALTGTGTAGSTSDTTPKYTPTKWTFDSGISVANGEVYFIKIPETGGTYGVWCSLDDGTTYYPVAISNGKGRFTTHYAKNTVIAITYESAGVCTCYPLDGGDATSDVTKIFRVLNDYDANTNTYVTQTATNTTNANYEVLFSATADNTTRTEGARKSSTFTYNPSTGLLSTTTVRASTALEVNNTTTNASSVRFRFSDLSSSQYATLFATRDANYGGRLNFRQYSENSSGTLLSKYENYQLPKTAQGLSANKTYTIVTTKNLISGSSITVSDSSGDVTLSIPDTTAPTYTLSDSQPNEWSANGLLATRWGNVVQVVLSLKNKSSYTYQAGSIGYAGTVTGTYMPARPLTLIGYSGTAIFMGWFEKTSETTGTIEVKGNINVNLSVGQTITVTGTFITNTNT